MLYMEFNIMISNRFSYTTTTQQKHNKFYFVAATGNSYKFCCGLVVAITFCFTVI
jgi:hypothetical protein